MLPQTDFVIFCIALYRFFNMNSLQRLKIGLISFVFEKDSNQRFLDQFMDDPYKIHLIEHSLKSLHRIHVKGISS